MQYSLVVNEQLVKFTELEEVTVYVKTESEINNLLKMMIAIKDQVKILNIFGTELFSLDRFIQNKCLNSLRELNYSG